MNMQKPAEKRKMVRTVTVQQDPETGEYYIEFPPEMMEELGWKNGDELIWEGNNETYYVRKKYASTMG